MLRRAFGALTLAGFWRHWNPIFGYGLSRFVYAPLRRRLAHEPALFTTFVVCGALHDAVTMLVRGSGAFLFTPWFAGIATAILLADRLTLTLHVLGFGRRALTHTTVLATTFAIGRLIESRVLGT
jgi:D-alanyl-lipoteichoic acid acyltransferase DltB (MBOAT superfamily)